MYIDIYVYICVFTYIGLRAREDIQDGEVFLYVPLRLCITYISISVYMYIYTHYICQYLFRYVYKYVCMYIYVYLYV